jgi:hypothetical protein
MSVDNIPAEDNSADKQKRTQVTPAIWAEIVEHFELGTMSGSEIATKYGIAKQTLSDRFKREGIKGGSRAHEVKKAVAQAVQQNVQAAVVETFSDKRKQYLEETNVGAYKSLELAKKLLDKVIVEALKSNPPQPPAAIFDDIKSLRLWNKALIENTQARRHILGAEDMIDESALPEITIDDITGQMILDHHKKIGAAPEDATVEDLAAIVGDLDIEI